MATRPLSTQCAFGCPTGNDGAVQSPARTSGSTWKKCRAFPDGRLKGWGSCAVDAGLTLAVTSGARQSRGCGARSPMRRTGNAARTHGRRCQASPAGSVPEGTSESTMDSHDAHISVLFNRRLGG
jgi:hypothetical protein